MTSPYQNPPGTEQTGNQAGTRTGDGSALGQEAHDLGEHAKAAGTAHMQQARASGAVSLDKLADSAEAAAERLRQDDVGHMSEYVSKLAAGMHRLSGDLREKSGDEILRDIGRLARENPALFVTGSVAIGFGIGRFARASQPHLPVPADEARPYSATSSSATAAREYPSDGPVAGSPATDASTGSAPGTRGGTH